MIFKGISHAAWRLNVRRKQRPPLDKGGLQGGLGVGPPKPVTTTPALRGELPTVPPSPDCAVGIVNDEGLRLEFQPCEKHLFYSP